MIPRYGLFAAPCLWVSLELVRTYFLTGLPWALLGYSQYREIDLIQIADHTGVYGVSFVIVFVNVALAELLAWIMPYFRGFRPAKLPWELVTTAALLVGLSWAYSSGIMTGPPLAETSASVRIEGAAEYQPGREMGCGLSRRNNGAVGSIDRASRYDDGFGGMAGSRNTVHL